MTNANPTFQLYADFYPEVLLNVRGITFTPRHIDIIACLINGEKDKRIGQLLSIREGTVETHKSNIRHEIQKKSHEDIIRFTQKSSNIHLIRDHYQRLLFKFDVEKGLKSLAVLSKRKNLICCIKPDAANKERLKTNSSFIRLLCQHLTLAGITIGNEEAISELHTWTLHLDSDVKEGSYQQNHIHLLYKSSKNSSDERVNTIDFRDPQHYFSSLLTLLQTFFSESDLGPLNTLLNEGNDRNLSFYKNDMGTIPLDNSSLPAKFKTLVTRATTKRIAWIVFAFFITISCYAGFSYVSYKTQTASNNTHQNHFKKNLKPIRSEFPIPAKNSFLERPNLKKEIEKKLASDKGIQTVVLMGSGGSGKTILAYAFGRSYTTNVAWKLNAETKENLINSFHDLTRALATTDAQRQELEMITRIQDKEQRDNKLLYLVKEWLNERKKWLLVYDNVEDISILKNYFPHDPNVWGNGKVIITTQNENIQNTEYIERDKIIKVKDLNDNEKLKLFSLIYYEKSSEKLSQDERKKCTSFLKELPPFPLDILAAADYLKATNIPFNEYLEKLKHYLPKFEKILSQLAKDRGFHEKTRFMIIKLSLEKIIDSQKDTHTQKDFKDLALFISLLDSQNIPKSLLDKHTNNINVENFIVHLKKYSLITSESSTSIEQSFSIHRSTQTIMLAYLTKILQLEQNKQYLSPFAKTLATYMEKINDDEDHSRASVIVSHINKFLSHEKLLKTNDIAVIKSELSGMYYFLHDVSRAKVFLKELEKVLKKNDPSFRYVVASSSFYKGLCITKTSSNFKKAGKLFQQSLDIYKKYFQKNYVRIVGALLHLGRFEIILGNAKKAYKLFEEAHSLYEKHDPTNYSRIFGILRHLENARREYGDYKKARDELNKIKEMYNQHHPERVYDMGWILIHLGNVYRDLGDYQKSLDTIQQGISSFDTVIKKSGMRDSTPWQTVHLAVTFRKLGNYIRAKDTLERDRNIIKKLYPKNRRCKAWILAHLGTVYKDMGYYEDAKNLLEQASEDYIELFTNENIHTAWAITHLGNIYNSLEDYSKAKDYLQRSLIQHEKYFGKNHIKSGWVLLYLGDAYNGLKDYTKASQILQRSLDIHKQHYENNHIETARVLISLGWNVLLQKQFEKAKSYFEEALIIFEKSNHPEIYKVYESLADLNIRKSEVLQKDSKTYKALASSYLKQAMEVLIAHFPKDSPHRIRVEKKFQILSIP